MKVMGFTHRHGFRLASASLAAMLLASGCSHPLVVKNMDLYKPEFINSQPRSTKIGLSSVTSTPEEERLALAVANTLKRDGFSVVHPYHASEQNRATVDYVVKLVTSSEYKGSGWNFLINWPGFLIWTPAWHGYNYRAIYGFDADVMHAASNESLPRISAPLDLDIRHADMNRTWTEVSWLEYSVIALVGGIVFTRYDQSITPQLVNSTESRISEYVASKIASSIVSDRDSREQVANNKAKEVVVAAESVQPGQTTQVISAPVATAGASAP